MAHELPAGHKLLSASGGDQEFRPIIKDLKTKPILQSNGIRGPLRPLMVHPVRLRLPTSVFHTTS
jgi:hypothetical protein